MSVSGSGFADLVDRRWLAFAAGLLLALGLATSGIPKIRLDVSNQALFVQGDETLTRYEAMKETFGSDEVIFVLVEVPDAFDEPHLSRLLALGDALEALPFVEQVRSPLRSPVSTSRDGEIVSESVADERPTSDAERAEWRRKVLGYELFQGLLISPDARHVGFTARLANEVLTPEGRVQVADAFAAVLADEALADYPRAAVGTAINTVLVGRIIGREIGVALLSGLLISTLALLLLFRSLRAAAAPVLVLVATLAATFGIMGLSGRPMSQISAILVTLIVCVAIADCMHVVSGYERWSRLGRAPAEALRLALRESWQPCLATSLTTAAGFLSLLTSRVAPIANLGLFAAVGAILAYGLMLLLVPALLLGWRPAGASRGMDEKAPLGPDRTRRLLDAVRGLALGRPRLVLAGAGLLTALAVAGLPRLYADEDLLENLSPDEPLRRDVEFVHDRMGGAIAAEVVLRPLNPKDPVAQAKVLLAAEGLERWLEAVHPAVRSVRGIPDGLGELHRLFDGPRAVPADPAAVAQLLLLLESSDSQFYASHSTIDGSALRITLRCDLIGSREYKAVLAQIEDELTRRFAGLAEAEVTGGAMLLSRANEYILQTQFESFALALAVVSFLVVLGAGSFRLGVLSLVPNLVPVLLVLGLMGWAGIAIEVANVLIATIAIGIVVDDTIHFVHGFREASREGLDTQAAVARTFERAGRAIFFTSGVLVLGFAAYLVSDLRSVRQFGLLTAATFTAALIADLLVLPALLALWPARSEVPEAEA